MNNFAKAAASYFGLGEIVPRKVEVFSDGLSNVVVIELNLTDEDLVGIAGRMQAMQQISATDDRRMTDWDSSPVVVANEQKLRDEYDSLDKVTKSRFGAFHRYKAWRLDGGAEPTGEPERAPVIDLPAHVYLTGAECTAQQRAMAIGQDEKGRYAIAVEDLTVDQVEKHCNHVVDPAADQPTTVVLGERVEELTADRLRQAYIERTVQAHAKLNEPRCSCPSGDGDMQWPCPKHGRLSGADGKPTSNADDFGGLPG